MLAPFMASLRAARAEDDNLFKALTKPTQGQIDAALLQVPGFGGKDGFVTEHVAQALRVIDNQHMLPWNKRHGGRAGVGPNTKKLFTLFGQGSDHASTMSKHVAKVKELMPTYLVVDGASFPRKIYIDEQVVTLAGWQVDMLTS